MTETCQRCEREAHYQCEMCNRPVCLDHAHETPDLLVYVCDDCAVTP